jgi:hypothetical protein
MRVSIAIGIRGAILHPSTGDRASWYRGSILVWTTGAIISESTRSGSSQFSRFGEATIRLLRLNALERIVERGLLEKLEPYPAS